jgi:hypothetical protein
MVQVHVTAQDLALGLPGAAEQEERAARRALRAQIARLERELSDTLVAAFPYCGPHLAAGPSAGPRVLSLGELEQVRDGLVARLADSRAALGTRAEQWERNRRLLEKMLLEPGRYKFTRVRNADLGEPGCGVWQVRPRLGLIGMLMGWWQVKLSSGCPLPT